ncbi:MAG: GNAT family N-acetyltransferase [Actinomycetota bacterium]
MTITCTWRGPFVNTEISALHAAAFDHPVSADDWQGLADRHSLGWVTARRDGTLAGFVNVVWDGALHAWIQDLMVAPGSRRQGIGTRLAAAAREGARAARCDWLHVDFEDDLRVFYVDACGFTPVSAGLIALR